jgi:hypothetical protein
VQWMIRTWRDRSVSKSQVWPSETTDQELMPSSAGMKRMLVNSQWADHRVFRREAKVSFRLLLQRPSTAARGTNCRQGPAAVEARLCAYGAEGYAKRHGYVRQ